MEVAGEGPNEVAAGRMIGLAVSAQIEGVDAVVGDEQLGNVLPVASVVHEAVDENDGEIELHCNIPAATAATAESLSISYQPDFDTDVTFSPPQRTDSLEQTLQKLYLHELRWAGKTWSGTGSNFGAIVDKTFTVNIA